MVADKTGVHLFMGPFIFRIPNVYTKHFLDFFFFLNFLKHFLICFSLSLISFELNVFGLIRECHLGLWETLIDICNYFHFIDQITEMTDEKN